VGSLARKYRISLNDRGVQRVTESDIEDARVGLRTVRKTSAPRGDIDGHEREINTLSGKEIRDELA
jgi:hypothetical protein